MANKILPMKDEIEKNIGSVIVMLIALRNLAIQHENGVDGDTLSIVVEHMSKAGMLALDNCLADLGCARFGTCDQSD